MLREHDTLIPVRASLYLDAEGQEVISPEQQANLDRQNEMKLFVGDTIRAIYAQLDMLHRRDFHELVSCPSARLLPCTAACKCDGKGVVTVGQLVKQAHDVLAYLGEGKPPSYTRRRRRLRM